MLIFLLPVASTGLALIWFRKNQVHMTLRDLQTGAFLLGMGLLFAIWSNILLAEVLNDHPLARSHYIETIDTVEVDGRVGTRYIVTCEFDSGWSRLIAIFPSCDLDQDSPKVIVDHR